VKILAAIDNSSCKEAVLKAISSQAQPRNTAVRVLHVLQPIAGSAPPQMAPGYSPELEPFAKPAWDLLKNAQKELASAGFDTDVEVKKGDIRETILDTAEEWGADLIVLGSHNNGGVRRLVLGSVAEYVARYAKCSVEIVRNSRDH